MQFRYTFLKNAASNVVRGGAATLVALVLPHFLSRSLDAARFAAWALVLQMAAYANYLDFGLQTAIARFVAQALELGQESRRDQIVSTSAALLVGAATLAYLLICLAIWQLPRLFQQVPSGLLGEFREAALLLAGSSALVVALSAFPSTLLGMHRNELVAVTVGSSRLLGALLAIVVARRSQALVPLAFCVGGCNVLASLAQVAMVRRLLSSLRMRLRNVRRGLAGELARYCVGLTVWNVGLLIVTGLDLILVGRYNFQAVGSYSIALTAAAMFAGVNSYIVTALLAPLAVLHARGDMTGIGRILLSVTGGAVLVNGAVALCTFLLGAPLLHLWVGGYAASTLPILELLMVAQAIRLSGLTFSITLVAIGEQNKGMAQGYVEAVVNLVCSLFGVVWFGPLGVAWGTLLGAVCNFAWICLVTIVRVKGLPTRPHFLHMAVLRPAICLLPLLCLTLVPLMSLRTKLGLLMVVITLMMSMAHHLMPWRSAFFQTASTPIS